MNDELIQGPEIPSSAVGNRARFRKEDIAFTADIEAIYYQVLVPEHQQNLLRFVWWPEGDTSEDPVD